MPSRGQANPRRGISERSHWGRAPTRGSRAWGPGWAPAPLKKSRTKGQRVGRVLTESELIAAVADDRIAGRTIAFANGCFDLVHVGHVRYLRGAAAEADRLIVAVNDDRSVAGLKGEGRPILPAAERAELVASLRGVDYVVVFADPTVERLLLLVKPDVHCK